MEKSNRICRTCLKSSPTMVPLFNDTSLCRKILAISSVVVSPEGNLPTVVCLECIVNINSAFKFRQVLINSDARLKTAIIKNAKRRLDMQKTTDPLALSPKDNENECSQNQAVIIKLEDSSPVTTCIIDFNPFREESLQSSNVGPIGEHPDISAKESLNHERAVLPSNLTKFLDSAPKKRLAPGNRNALRKEARRTKKSKAKLALPENRQSSPPVNISPIDLNLLKASLERKLSPVNGKAEGNTQRKEAAPQAKQSNVLVKDRLCQICGKLFAKPYFLGHFSSHNEVSVSCTVCGKVVKNALSLRYHMNNHRAPIRTCQYCGKTFKHISNYLNHVNVHTGNKKFKCEVCDKRFALSATLKHHMQTHTGERPHPCKYCKKGFTSRYALKTHIRQHTNEKPYTCEHCSMGFHQKVSLTTHLKSAHNQVITS